MSQDIDAPDFVSLHFPTVKRGARHWRHIQQRYTEDWVLKLLRQIDNDRAEGHGTDVAWLIPYRPEIRAVIRNSHPASIHSYLAKCQSEMIPLCVWLLGQCAEPRRHYGLSAFRYDPSPQIRKHVAKALRARKRGRCSTLWLSLFQKMRKCNGLQIYLRRGDPSPSDWKSLHAMSTTRTPARCLRRRGCRFGHWNGRGITRHPKASISSVGCSGGFGTGCGGA